MGQELPPDLSGAGRGGLIRLVTRLLVAQAAAAGAIGLFFSRRHLPSIIEPGPEGARIRREAASLRSGRKEGYSDTG